MRLTQSLSAQSLGLLLTLGTIAATEPPPSSSTSPVSLASQTEQNVDGRRTFILTLRNDSHKPIVGFIVVCSLLDSQGKAFDKSVLGGSTLDPNETRYDPGATWKIQVEASSPDHPATRVAGVVPSFDYILFRDLSNTGPDTEKRGILLRREYEGSQMQLARLRRLLATKGIEAVREILLKDEPRFSRFSKP